MAGRIGRATPRPTSAPARKGKAATRSGPKSSVLGRVFARPGMIVAGAAFTAVMTGIVANALMFQKGHHPSPLFSSPAASQIAGAEPTRLVPAPAATPVPVPRPVLEEPAPPAPEPEAAAPAPKAAASATAVTHPAALKSAAHKATPPHKAVAAVAHRDPIGQLLSRQAGNAQ